MTTAPVPSTLNARPGPAPGRDGGRGLIPAVSGSAYVLAWVAGLAAWPVNLALNATAGQATAAFRLHPAEAITQLVLVEGLAAILLGVVLAGLVLRPGLGRGRPAAAAVAVLAVLTSLAQCGVGLAATVAAVHHHVASCGDLAALLNRLDGVKMLALAAVAAWLAATPAVRAWLRVLSGLLAAAIALSGYAYLTLANSLAWAAYISGPLLLAWVAGTGFGHFRTGRRQHAG